MKTPWLPVLLAMVFSCAVGGQEGAASNATVVVEFSHPGSSLPQWTLALHRDGSGHFRSQRGDAAATEQQKLDAPNVDRDVRLSADFAARVFQIAERHRWFNEPCESHQKVAFQGWKKFSYLGPEGQGSCTFNYAKDAEIQSLGDQMMGVAETLLAGARLEALRQHDPLGLDKETEFLVEAAKDGRIGQICAIREILEKLESDEGVLERVRKRARALLASEER